MHVSRETYPIRDKDTKKERFTLSHAYDFLRTKLPVTAFCSAKHSWELVDDINDRDVIVISKVMIF